MNLARRWALVVIAPLVLFGGLTPAIRTSGHPATALTGVHAVGATLSHGLRTNVGASIRSSSTVVNGVLYIGSENKVLAMIPSNGHKIWIYKKVSGTVSAVVVNGVVYAGTGIGDRVFALKRRTGLGLEIKIGGIVDHPPWPTRFVYVCSSDHNVYALRASNGAKMWSYDTGVWTDSSPAVADGVVYVGGDKLYALDASTGKTTELRRAHPLFLPYGGQWGGVRWLVHRNLCSARLFRAKIRSCSLGSTYAPAVIRGIVYASSDD